VPINPEFGSLNLAQAVNLFAFLWAQSSGLDVPDIFEDVRSEIAPREDLTGLMDHLETELLAAGFFFPEHKAEAMKTRLRNMWSRYPMTTQDVRMLHGLMRQMVRWKDQSD
jgi:tRNA/rRNA methyltransferase